ncbi:MAG: hypothetical protein GF387_01710 [Candidatus Portnoybacteria bacterium]|nr:hypothetical protein [Candidatus Portnoybacteria bacterium]
MKKENGQLIFKKGFFIKYLWGFNSFFFILNKFEVRYKAPKYPKDICSLFWGSIIAPLVWIGNALYILLFTIGILGIIVMLLCMNAIEISLKFFFGTLPRKETISLIEPPQTMFHPYKRYGEYDEKKLLFAPWEIVTFLLVIYLAIRNFSLTKKGAAYICQMPIFWIAMIIIAIIVGMIFFFRSTSGKLLIEFLKAKKKKICPLIKFE